MVTQIDTPLIHCLWFGVPTSKSWCRWICCTWLNITLSGIVKRLLLLNRSLLSSSLSFQLVMLFLILTVLTAFVGFGVKSRCFQLISLTANCKLGCFEIFIIWNHLWCIWAWKERSKNNEVRSFLSLLNYLNLSHRFSIFLQNFKPKFVFRFLYLGSFHRFLHSLFSCLLLIWQLDVVQTEGYLAPLECGIIGCWKCINY